MLDTWGTNIQSSFIDIGNGIVQYVPDVLLAIVIVIAGWVVGALIGKLIAQLFRTLRVDQLLRTAGVEEVTQRAGYNLDSGRFVGALVKWFIIVVFLVAAFDVLGLTAVNLFLQDVIITYLPNVIVSILILMVAAVLADIVSKIVIASSRAAGIKTANFLGAVTRWAIWIFAIIAVMLQLHIIAQFIQTLLTGVVVALSLAFGLAFGLGGQAAASEIIQKVRNDISSRH